MNKEDENYRPKTDEELMLKYQEDDSLAFNELYDRTAGRIQGYLLRRVQDKTLVDDILQGTYFKFHQTRSHYRPPLPVLPWLFTICQSVMIDTLRGRERHLKRIEDIDPAALPMEATKEKIPLGLEPVLLDGFTGVKKLSDAQKQALELRFGQDLSFEEIAKALETSPTNARQMVSRALRRLKGAAYKTRGGK